MSNKQHTMKLKRRDIVEWGHGGDEDNSGSGTSN
jgi:hypothetical protein